MEKLDAIMLKDEEGMHYIPLKNINSVCEEIGKYDYKNGEYRELYSKPRYVIRTVNGSESFLVTKQVYQKIIETCYNIILSL